ncbi:glycosyltransferase family 8 protein [Mycena vulgaris]|nr:glycosyltransferase family 8 protein [Mycena vulgaris]
MGPTFSPMLSALRPRFSDRRDYEPLGLEPNHFETPSRWRRWSGSRAVRIGLVIVAILTVVFLVDAVIIWFATRYLHLVLYRIPYNPMDHYQDINRVPVTPENGASHTSAQQRAVVSSLYSDGFAIAVAVVGHSAHSANVSARLLLPYLENQVSEKALCIARATGWEPYPVPFIPPPHGGEGIHPRFKDQYTKLNIWKLDDMGIKSAVYLDADTLVRRNFDELFDSPFNFAAVPDVYAFGDIRGFSLSFNAGVLAYRPSSVIYEDMRRKIESAEYPLQQAEQAFLNLYFGGTCMRLPYVYNGNLAIKAKSPVLWQRLADEIRIVHYTIVKPFLHEERSSDTLLTLQEVEEAMDQNERRAGYYANELGWWREAYRKMMLERGNDIKNCY